MHLREFTFVALRIVSIVSSTGTKRCGSDCKGIVFFAMKKCLIIANSFKENAGLLGNEISVFLKKVANKVYNSYNISILEHLPYIIISILFT